MTVTQNTEYTMGRDDLDLKAEEERTLSTPRLPANVILKLMFLAFDLVYGRKRTLPKFKTLEIMARYPYWAWEDAAYRKLSKLYSRASKVPAEEADALLGLIDFGRDAQDNEQWHMMLLEEVIHAKGIKLGWLHNTLIPRIMTSGYYRFSRLVYRLCPSWSFAMNAAFESHAEHEYMTMAREHPEWDDEPHDSVFYKHYPRQKTLGDLIRRMGLDERDHMNHSLERVTRGKRHTN